MRYRFMGFLYLVIVAAISVPSFANIKSEHIVAYWLLDDGKGDEAIDGSGNEYHGKITGGKWVAGKIDGGLEFDGVTTFIEVENSDEFNFTDSVTLTAWANIDSIPMQHIGIPRKETQYVLHPTDAGGKGFNLRFYVGIDGGWAPPVISQTVVNYGEWHHLAGTYDGKELKVYIDGKLDKAQPQSGEIAPTQNPLRWSNDCCGGRMMSGVLDELVILNRALDETEVQQLMEGILSALSVEPMGKLAVLWGAVKSR